MKEQKFNSLDEILRASLIKKDENRSKTVDNNWIWASELGMCPRAQFLRRLGIPRKRLKWRYSFCGELGSAMHDRIENTVKGMHQLIVAEEKIINEKLHYKGRLDLIINLGTKKDPYLSLVDIKTQGSKAFSRRKYLPTKTKVNPAQRRQLCSYTYFALQKWPEIQDSRLYYLDRDSGMREEFIFHFTDKDFAEMLTEINTLNDYWDKQIIPPCKDTWLCKESCRPYRKDLIKVEQKTLTIKEFVKKHGIKKEK